MISRIDDDGFMLVYKCVVFVYEIVKIPEIVTYALVAVFYRPYVCTFPVTPKGQLVSILAMYNVRSFGHCTLNVNEIRSCEISDMSVC